MFDVANFTPTFTEYAAQQPATLGLREFPNGSLLLNGGFDSTLVDGIAMLFDVTATAVPEPASLSLLLVSGVCLLSFRRRRGRIR